MPVKKSIIHLVYPIQYPEGIKPQMFKRLIGRGHPEFSTKRQQDAQEFILHLFNTIEVSESIQFIET